MEPANELRSQQRRRQRCLASAGFCWAHCGFSAGVPASDGQSWRTKELGPELGAGTIPIKQPQAVGPISTRLTS